MKIRVINNINKDAKLPSRAHYNDAGADVFTLEDITLEPHETKTIGLGYGIQLPDGVMCCTFPKSGLSSKGIISQIAPIDSGYTGEIHCTLTNTTNNQYQFNKGDKVAQLVVIPIILCDFVTSLGDERGDNGFGSTGK